MIRLTHPGKILIADGSTGTALEAAPPEFAASGRLALVPLERPEVLQALHERYFLAGSDLVETATFSASARDLARAAADYGEDPFSLSERLNRAAAQIARHAADRAYARDGKKRYVAGSMGPGDAPPSLGASTYEELVASYLPQARGLAQGGVDLVIIETCQDPLQIKAAIAALRSSEGGRGLPFIVSATVDEHGRMLAGSDIAAFIAIVEPFKPLALGLNCSGGPEQFEASLCTLAELSPLPISFMPNAGLPCTENGCVSYPYSPEQFGQKVAELAVRYGVALVGGCCGSGPEHIAALAACIGTEPEKRPTIPPRPPRRPALCSLTTARPIGPDLFRIGERANTAGSAAFAALLDKDDFEGMAEWALRQEQSGADAIDLHVSRPGRNEAEDLVRLVSLLAPRARAALCLDSSDPEVLAKALPYVGGRSLLNSASLENEQKARRIFELAHTFGAAVICLAMDEKGPARTIDEKVRICRELYNMAIHDYDLDPASLFFDPLTFTIAAGGDALTTIHAISAIKEACPGAFTVLGVGNVSYGLPKSVRSAVTSVFLAAARSASLDTAIMNIAGIPDIEKLDPALRAVAEQALGLSTAPEDPLEPLLKWAAAHEHETSQAPSSTASKESLKGSAIEGGVAQLEDIDPIHQLTAAILRGDTKKAYERAQSLAAAGPPERLTTAVTAAMAQSGELWNTGVISLPLVLRSAEAARHALSVLTARPESLSKGTVIMATVKGDLHDIGKNIVAAILACSGWRVVDLGTDVPAPAIVETARRERAHAVGLSGLLTRSLLEMKTVCNALQEANLDVLVLCGGAAAHPGFVEREIAPLHPGLVRYSADAFEALKNLDEFIAAPRSAPYLSNAPRASAAVPTASSSAMSATSSAVLHTNSSETAEVAQPAPIGPHFEPSFIPPFYGATEPLTIPLRELVPLIDTRALFSARWHYRPEDRAKAAELLQELLAHVESLATPTALYGYYACRRTAESIVTLELPPKMPRELSTTLPTRQNQATQPCTFDLPFPREEKEPRRTLAAYFSPERDAIAFFAVTVGPEIARAARSLKEQGQLEAYWHLHGLASALAEAAAQWTHNYIIQELAASGQQNHAPAPPLKSRRYSFGYPACPGLEYQRVLLDLLDAQRIGLSVTSGYQLVPEHSVTAFLIVRPDAIYFSA